MKSPTADGTRTIGEAWTQATRLSAGGLLHEATLGFLRLRVLLCNEKSKLQGFKPGGKGQTRHATQGMEDAQAMAPSAKACAKATCVVDKLLSKVERELRSHLRFLKTNHYAALQLPLPRRASANRTSPSGGISDALVKSNYRRLALRFHPDKTGTDSSALFSVVRTAYESLATPRGRARHQPPSSGPTTAPDLDTDTELWWAADFVAAGSVQQPPNPVGRSAEAAQGRAGLDCSSQASGQCRRDSAPRKEENSCDGFEKPLSPDRNCNGESTAGVNDGTEDALRHGSQDEGRSQEPRIAAAPMAFTGCPPRRINGQAERGSGRQDPSRVVVKSTSCVLGVDFHGAVADSWQQQSGGCGKEQLKEASTGGGEPENQGEERTQAEEYGGDRKGDIGVGRQETTERDELRESSTVRECEDRDEKMQEGLPRRCREGTGQHHVEHHSAPSFRDQETLQTGTEQRSAGLCVNQTPTMLSKQHLHCPLPPPHLPAAAPIVAPFPKPTRLRPIHNPPGYTNPKELVPARGRGGTSSQPAFCEPGKLGGRAEGEPTAEIPMYLELPGDIGCDAIRSNRDGDIGGGGSAGRCVRRLRDRVKARNCPHATASQSRTHAFYLQEEVDFWISGARGGEVWHKGVPPGCMSFDAGGGRATAVDDNEVADHGIEDVQASGCVPDGRGVSSPRTVQCNRRHRRREPALGTGGDDTLDKLVRAVVASPKEGEDEEISPTPSPRYLKAGVVPNSSEWINVRTGLVAGTSTTTELNFTPSDEGRRRRDTRFSIGAGEDGSVLFEQCEHCQGDRVPIAEARKERLANQGHDYVKVKTCGPGMRASTSDETMAPVSGEEIWQSTVHRHHRHRHRILSSEPDTAEMLRETVLGFWEPKDAAAATASPLAVAADATAGGLFEHAKITTTTGLEGRGWFWGAPA